MKKGVFRSIVSVVLAGLVAFTSIQFSVSTVVADSPAPQFELYVNGTSAAASQNLEVAYGDILDFEIKDAQGTTMSYPTNYAYAITDDDFKYESFTPIEDGAACELEPGTKYYLIYDAKVSDTENVTGGLNKEFAFTVTKGKIAAPSNVWWSGSAMNWEVPTKTTGGGNLKSGTITGYKISFYKNGTFMSDISCDASKSSYDNIANTILLDDDYKQGVYSFEVTAITGASNAYYAAEGSKSSVSEGYTVPLITLSGDSGISALSPTAGAILLPGNSDHNSTNISATLKEDFGFLGWSGTGVTFENYLSAATRMTVSADYDGSTEMEVKAVTQDNIAPTVSDPVAGSAPGTIMVAAVDEQTGIYEYAFSTADQAEDVTEWVEDETHPKTLTMYSHSLTGSGTYYFWAKDESSNVSRSTNPVSATQVQYKNFSKTGTEKDLVSYMIGEGTYTLTVPSCKGYTFEGWYDNPQLTGSKITSVSAHSATGYTFYAKWEEETLNPSITGISKEYDGQESALTVSVTASGNLTYQWYKDSGEITGATGATLSLKNVADSGSYYVTVKSTDDDGTEVASESSNTANVSITAKELTVTADDKDIFFGDALPELTFSTEGLIDGDVLTPGTIECEYTQGDPAGEYPITVSGFSAVNYDVVQDAGTLTVNTRGSENVTAALVNPEEVFTYDGSAKEPAVVVKDGNIALTAGTDYTLTYSNNVNASTDTEKAAITVTLKGNYEGEKTVEFTINKATFTANVIISGWKYGDEHEGPSISTIPSDGDVTYLYALKNSEEYTAVQPSDAGEYKVKAVIAATANYEQVETAAVNFTITKRSIIITADSGTFEYDGMEHSKNSYQQSGDGFAQGQAFSKVVVEGVAKDVTDENGVPNVITYSLTSSTNPDNYTITPVNGKLVITTCILTVPSGVKWETSSPGSASWIAVVKGNLKVKYSLYLYAYDGETYTEVNHYETTNNSYDFSGDIRSYATTAADNGEAYSYFFTIQSIPADGEAKDNYKESGVSDKIGPVYTAEIKAVKTAGVTSMSMKVNDQSITMVDNVLRYVIIQNETAKLNAWVQAGSNIKDWTRPSTINFTVTTWWISAIEAPLSYRHGQDAEVTIPSGITKSLLNQVIYVNLKDDNPWVSTFEGTNNTGNTDPLDDYKNVKISFVLKDGAALGAWALTKSDVAPAADSSDWVPIEGENVTRYEGTTYVSEEGIYYLYVKDATGNISRAYDVVDGKTVGSKTVTVYKVTLKDGCPDDNPNKKDPVVLYKVKNTTMALPTVESLGFSFEDGYAFQNWYGTTGIYEAGGGYGYNASDVLEAHWTNKHFDFTVNYFQMGLDGNYSDTPSSQATFDALYGTKVKSDSDFIQNIPTGFTIDEDHIEEITVSEEGLSLSVYYNRNKHNVIYSFNEPGKDVITTKSVEYFYGASLANAFDDSSKTQVFGYDFVGWSFGDEGAQPQIMPDKDVNVTGEYQAKSTKYYVRYYIQNLDSTDQTKAADTYTLVDSMNLELTSYHGQEIIASVDTMAEIEGFTFYKAAATFGTEGGATVPASAEEELTTNAVYSTVEDGNYLYVNVYYNRNTYTATLNVWQGTVEVEGNLIYTHSWSALYGAPIDGAAMEVYEKDKWVHDEEYTLAKYVDWSTGTRASVMPAGDVTITRQYVKQVEGSYNVEVWIETATEGTYNKQTYSYYGTVGETVTVGNGTGYTIDYNSYRPTIDYYDYYEYRVVTDQEVTDDIIRGAGLTKGSVVSERITDTNGGETPAVMRIFFERKKVNANINYYYNSVATGGSNVKFASVIKKIKWGHNYCYEPLGFFDVQSGGTWSSEGYEPGSYTIVTNIKESGSATETAPDMYDFRNNGFVVSYLISDGNAKSFNTVASLGTAFNKEGNMWVSGETVNVYYVQADPDEQYYLDVYYNKDNLSRISPKEGSYPVIHNYEGEDYYVRVANEAKFYKDTTYVIDSGCAEYPGLARYNVYNSEVKGHYVYTKTDSNIKDGYTKVTIGTSSLNPSGECYITDTADGSGKKYIYIPLSDNRLFFGKTTAVTVGHGDAGYYVAENFLAGYKATYADDPYAYGAYIYNRSYGTTLVTGNGNLTITFHNGEVYSLNYRLNNATIYYTQHASGTTVNKSQFYKVDDSYKRLGYEVVWYADSMLTTKAESVYMNTTRYLYGKYEKLNVKSYEYAYYELYDRETVEGTEYRYITENDIDKFSGITSETVDGVTTYTYKGSVIMIKKEHPAQSFTEISMSIADYSKTGFVFDEANDKNLTNGYVEAEPIALRAYYARQTFDITIDQNIPNVDVEGRTYRYGQTITIDPPSRNGYTFQGWSWYKLEEGTFVEWTEGAPVLGQDDVVTFNQPLFSTKAVAIWQPTTFDQLVIHYYQNSNLAYDTDQVAYMMRTAGTAADISFNGETPVSGMAFPAELSGAGVAYVDAYGLVRYFTGATYEYGVYNVLTENLAAIVDNPEVLQENEVTTGDFTIDQPNYEFSKAVRQFNGVITELEIDDTFIIEYGMTLECYYVLSSGFKLTTEAVDTKGTTFTATLFGQGDNYYYSQKVILSAALPAGYDFVGWYLKSDVIKEGKLIEDLSEAPIISASSSVTVTVRGDEDYIAVATARAVARPDMVVSGISSLAYGYKASDDQGVSVLATFANGTDSANYVKSYQWYISKNSAEFEKITKDGTSATYLVPEGWNVGTYVLKCDVTVARRDNGLEETFTSGTHTVSVGASPAEAECKSETVTYDGKNHSVKVSVSKPEISNQYKVYYSSEEELTSENYSTKGSTTVPQFKNVKVDAGGNVLSNDVYYYVHSLTDNYTDITGHATVTINPKPLTLGPGSKFYFKTYDGYAQVKGDVMEEGTDLYNLFRGDDIYRIIGLVEEDALSGAYIASGKGTFNSSHVHDANALTLSDLVLINSSTGDINYNYIFDPSYSITLSGYIEKKQVTLNWDGEKYTYDATVHCPGATIKDEETTIPDVDQGHLGLTIAGGQTNEGIYSASATMTSSDESTQVTDFSIVNSGKTFTIEKREITIKPEADSFEYDGLEHTLTSFSVTAGSIPEGFGFTVSADSSQTKVGEYTVFAQGAHIIKDDTKDDVTDNYTISYDSDTLTITKRTIRIAKLSGITADDKYYDGTTTASLQGGEVEFDRLVEGDELTFDITKVTGNFDTKDVGEDKTVTLTMGKDALTGANADDYDLNIEESQNTTTASILSLEVTVTPDEVNVVYGEDAEFTSSFSGLIAGETPEAVITGDVTYKVGLTEDTAVPYTSTLGVGTYNIYADISELEATNYTFAKEVGTLNVTARPVSVGAADGANIVKSYDGTTDATVTASDYAFGGTGAAASGIVNGDTLTLSYTGAYNDANVSVADKVGMTGLSINNANYQLVTTSFDIPGSITKAQLEVKADKKNITYGDAAPAYTVTYNGFVNNEDKSVLGGTLSIACSYDNSQAGNREAKDYTITPSGYTSGNYEITFTPGTLTVGKKAITIKADDKSATYGVDPIPEFTYTSSGFVYGETFDSVVTGTVTFNCDAQEEEVSGSTVVTSVSGDYPITPVVTGLSADNYSFTPSAGKLEVKKYNLTVTGIEVGDKVYDGKTDVYQSQFTNLSIIGEGGVTYDGMCPVDVAYFAAHPDEAKIKVTGTYDNKNVGTDKTVTLVIEPGEYLKSRCYVIAGSQTEAKADITKRPVLITADDKDVKYGEAAPAFTAKYGKTAADISGLVSGETADSSNVTLSSDYVADAATHAFTEVGDVAINVSDFTGTATALITNYAPEYEAGTLTVKQNKLTAPTVSWTTTPGTVSWTSVNGIGNVAVEKYVATLYKDGAKLTDDGAEVTVLSGDTLQANYSTLIHSKGAGVYTVKVKAVASETNNEGHKNVADSNEGVSGSLYAADVTFVYAADAKTQGGKGTISIKDLDTYTMIAGEQNVPIKAVLKNATGYTVKSVASSAAILTVATAADSARTGDTYNDTVSMGAALNSTAAITVTLTLSARPATVSAVVTPVAGEDQASATYGYSSSTPTNLPPVITAVASPVSGDNITASDYIYTYTWSLKEGTSKVTSDDPVTPAENNDTCTWTFPTGKNANTSTEYYKVQCVVTAERKDNGETATLDNKPWKLVSYVTNVTIFRAKFSATTSMEGWMYGETRKSPSITATVDDNPEVANVSYEYIKKSEVTGGSWSTDKPTDAGTYYVRGVIPEDINYEAFTTANVEFTISQNKLETPTNLSYDKSSKAGYGVIKWDAVPDVPENAGVTPASTATPSYEVKLYKMKDGVPELKKTYDQQEETELSIIDDIQENGIYKFTVQAISSLPDNCADSDVSEYSENIYIGAGIKAEGNGGTLIGGGDYSMMYDASNITLTAILDDTGDKTYQWYMEGEEIEDSDSSTLLVKHVSESANYSCRITMGGVRYYTPVINVAIGKRSVTMTSATDSKTYDGTALTNSTVTVTQDGFATGEGADYDVTGTQTDAGTSNNTFTYELTDATTEGDYTIATPVFGTLTVNQKEIVNDNVAFTVESVADVIYKGSAYTPEPVVTDISTATTEGTYTLVEGTDFTYSYENNINVSTAASGKAKVTITGKGNYKGTVTVEFSINKREVTFTGKSDEITYDGTKHSYDNDISITGDGLVSGHTHNVTYSLSGTEADTYTGTITAEADVVIKSGTTDVTANYDITTVAGSLIINQTDADWEVSLASDEYLYDATAHYNKNTATDKALTGTTTIKYSFEENGTYTEDLTSLKQTNAGEYTIYVKATNPNYSKTATTTAKLTINKRKVTFTGESDEITYDGNFYAYTNIAVTGDGLVTGHNDNVSYFLGGSDASDTAYEGDITEAEDVIIKDAGGTDVTANYDITTVAGSLTINKRTVTFTGETKVVTYNGSLQTFTGITTGGDGKATNHSDNVEYKVEGTEASDTPYAGTITDEADVVIKDSNNVDVTSNYDITTTAGSLTINKTDADWTVSLDADEYLYDATAHYNENTATNSALTGTTTIKYSFEENGTYTEDLTSLTKTAAGEYTIYVQATNPNYSKTAKTTSKLTINKRKVTFTGESDEITYDGDEHSYSDIDITEDGLVSGHTHNVTYSLSGTEAGTYNGTITAKASVIISAGTDEVVTSNYDITVVAGSLKINQTDDNWSIGLENDSCIYDATAHYTSSVATSTALTGTTTYLYSLKKDGTYTSDLTSLTRTEAGQDTIYVKATNPNYTKEATTDATFDVLKREVSFTGEKATKTYTGSEIQLTQITVGGKDAAELTSDNGLVSGHTHNVTYIAKGIEASEDEYAGTITAVTDVVIMDGDTNVTANYEIQTFAGSLTINKTTADWEISLDSDEYLYDATAHYNKNTAASTALTGTTSYEYSFEEEGTYTSDLTALTKTDAGEYTIYVKATNPNYTKEATTTAELTITKRTVTFTGDSDEITYDGQKHSYDGLITITGDGLVSGHTHNVTYSLSGTEADTYDGTITDEADVVIKSGTTDVTANYDITTEAGSLIINQTDADWTVSLEADEYLYDATAHYNANDPEDSALTGTTTIKYSFEENGTYTEDLTSLTKTDAGEYTIYVQATNPNYSKTAKTTSKLTINKRTITFTGESDEITYDGDEHSYSDIDITDDGLVSGHTHNVTYSLSGTEAGTYNGTITAKADVKILSGATDVTANYDITTTAGSLKINQTDEDWTVTFDDDDYLYDATAHYNANDPEDSTLTGTTSYEYSFEENGTYTSDLTALTKTDAGEYTIYVKATNPNYSKTAKTTAELIITKRTVTFIGESDEITYDGDEHSYSDIDITDDGLVSGHTHNVTYSLSGTEAGTYDGTITDETDVVIMSGSTDVTANYDITTTAGSLKINQTDEDWTVTLADDSYTYDATAHYNVNDPENSAITGTTTIEYSFEEEGTYTSDLTSLKQTDADEYTIYVKATNPNYSKTATTTAGLTINKRTVTFTGESDEITYDGQEHSYSGIDITGDGLVSGHTHNVTYSLSGQESGTYNGTITDEADVVIMSGTTDVTANYDITTTAGSLIINQSGAEWTVSLDDDTYTYDASAHHNTKTATTTAVSGETTIEYSFEKEGTYTTDLTSLEKTDAGEYTIYVKASNSSYSTVAKTEAKLIINPKAVTVAAKPASKVYGDTDPEAFETTISGLIGTDTVTYSINREVGEDAGEYDITPAGNEIQGNYKVTYTTAKFTITPKPVVLEWDNTVLFYTGELQSTNATVANKAFATDTFTIGYASVPAENRVHEATDVDDYIAEVVSLGNDNYTLTGATGVEHTWKIKYYLDIDAILVGNLHNGWYTGDVDIVPEADYAGIFEISLDRETWSDKLTYTENGDYEVIFYLRDTALGYQTDAMSKTFKIDAIAPTGEIDAGLNPFKTFINEISFGYFFKDNVDIVITGEDNGAAVNSGVDTVEYQKVLKGETYDIDGPWIKEEGDRVSFSVPATEENVIYARITDVAGHSVIISTDGLVVFFDSEADTAEVVYTRTTREDQTADVILNKNVIKEVADENGALEKDTDYTISADGKSITLTADYLESKAAGRYTITVSYNPLGETYQPKGDGKAPAETEFDILVKKAPGDVDITKVTNKIYDGKELDDIEETHIGTGTVTIEYKKVGDPDSAYTTEVPKDAGQYVVRVTVGEDENYEEAFDEKMVTINKRRITITPDDKEIVYGDPEPELTGTVENMAEGETLDVSYSRKKGTDVGEYKIKATAEPSDNYEAIFKTGKLTIVPKDISGATVTLGKLVVYTGGKQKQEIISVIIDGLVATWTVTGNEGKEPGKYTMEFTGNGNFCGTCYQDWLIVKQNVKADEIGDIVFEIICEEGAPETRFAMDESELIKAVISANEAAAVANGDVLIIWLEVKDISKTISAESKELLEKFAGEKTIGAFVDISLYKQLMSEPDATHIRETASKIRIAMGLPSSLLITDSTKEREYTVARNHEGQAELIESEYDKTNKELYLYSDRFSDYAIMYLDKNVGNNPGTADRNNPWLWASAMAFMAAGGGILIGRRRKKKDDEEE